MRKKIKKKPSIYSLILTTSEVLFFQANILNVSVRNASNYTTSFFLMKYADLKL